MSRTRKEALALTHVGDEAACWSSCGVFFVGHIVLDTTVRFRRFVVSLTFSLLLCCGWVNCILIEGQILFVYYVLIRGLFKFIDIDLVV